MGALRRAATVAVLGGVMAALPGIASADAAHGKPAHNNGHGNPVRGNGHGKRVLDLQAHRGGAAPMSENTIPAFVNALELGVSTLELDIAITQDGKAVVSHALDDVPRCPAIRGRRARRGGWPDLVGGRLDRQ
ncbi:glycerophosphodiester phosphodiesterase family protein [Microbispora hainanensis]|uniref:GP-PDE domain-containing protein n=1 Tax=Microbispora hainanensis TaxID=568844 RepID=A0A544XYC0_9ACTN|nr:glycerophosphodiester phosphodiesterase family protein [Microbispora hainanensis]TQS09508.1 hypothetical protein FLX08_38505 [Microbispora hainanensis]